MTINYDYTIEEKELLRQILEVRQLLSQEMHLRHKLEIDIKFLDAKLLRLGEMYPAIDKLTNNSYSELGDMIISLLGKFHRNGEKYVSFTLLFDRIRSSSLYSDKDNSHLNDISTALHTCLDNLEYKGVITSINRGNMRLIALSNEIKQTFSL
jgi:hypothetical protein